MIDASPKNFRHVLDYLRNPNYPFPKKLAYELDYYLIDYDINKLYDPNLRLLESNKKLMEANSNLHTMIEKNFNSTTSKIIDIYNETLDLNHNLESLVRVKMNKWKLWKE